MIYFICCLPVSRRGGHIEFFLKECIRQFRFGRSAGTIQIDFPSGDTERIGSKIKIHDLLEVVIRW